MSQFEHSVLARSKDSRAIALDAPKGAALVIELVTWCCFLAILLIVAFIPGRIDTPAWHIVAVGLMAIAVAAILLRHKYINQIHFKAALWVIGLMLLAQIWLILQATVPLEDKAIQQLFPIAERPAWFAPEFTWSWAPRLTMLLVVRDLVVLAAFICTLLLCNTTARLKSLLWVFLIAGLLHAIAAYVAWVEGEHLVDKIALDGHFDAMRGLFVNRNHFSGFLVVASLGCITPLLYRLYQMRSFTFLQTCIGLVTSRALIYLLVLVGFAFCIVMSESRAGFASLIIVVTVIVAGYGGALHSKERILSSDDYLVRSLIVLAVCVVALVSIVLLGQGVVERFGDSSSILGERPTQWLATLVAVADRPLIGFGGGTYKVVFEVYRDGYMLRDVFYDQAHNEYLHVLLEQGLIGLGLFVGVLWVLLRQLSKSLRSTRSRYRHALLLSLLAVFCAVVFQSLVDFNLQIVRIRVYFFVSLALLLVLARHDITHSHTSKYD